ncbi:hypothetical protein ACKVMT_02375 [Halobacteriales archaeon Cl-PHB]
MDRKIIGLAVGLISVSTLLITSSIVGVLALTSGDTAGIAGRVPYYVLAGAVVFTGLLVSLEIKREDGAEIISTSGAVSVVFFVVFSLGVEGLYFAYDKPDRVLNNLLPYFVAAGLVSTGLIIWGVRHWREFTTQHYVR